MPLNEFIVHQILKHSFENKGRNNIIAIEIKNDTDQQDCLTYLVDNGYLKPVTTNNKISGNRLAYIVTDKTIELYENAKKPVFEKIEVNVNKNTDYLNVKNLLKRFLFEIIAGTATGLLLWLLLER